MKSKQEVIATSFELLPDEYAILERLIREGRYRTKIDFLRTKLREEALKLERRRSK